MTNVMGLDPSLTSTGVIILDQEGKLLHRVSIGSSTCLSLVAVRMRRYATLISRVMAVVQKFRPTIVCVEGYALSSNTGKVHERIEYGGLLRWQLVAADVRVVEIAPSSLKKFATGKGRFPKGAGKDPMKVAIEQQYGVSLGTDDEYDAYGLSRIALQIAGFESSANQVQKEVVHVALHGAPVKTKRKAKKHVSPTLPGMPPVRTQRKGKA